MEGTNKMILSLPANATEYKKRSFTSKRLCTVRCALIRSEIGKWVELVSFHVQINGYSISAREFTTSRKDHILSREIGVFLILQYLQPSRTRVFTRELPKLHSFLYRIQRIKPQ